jgi:hypothetical protein
MVSLADDFATADRVRGCLGGKSVLHRPCSTLDITPSKFTDSRSESQPVGAVKITAKTLSKFVVRITSYSRSTDALTG